MLYADAVVVLADKIRRIQNAIGITVKLKTKGLSLLCGWYKNTFRLFHILLQ
jgi:hypothetical protein